MKIQTQAVKTAVICLVFAAGMQFNLHGANAQISNTAALDATVNFVQGFSITPGNTMDFGQIIPPSDPAVPQDFFLDPATGVVTAGTGPGQVVSGGPASSAGTFTIDGSPTTAFVSFGTATCVHGTGGQGAAGLTNLFLSGPGVTASDSGFFVPTSTTPVTLNVGGIITANSSLQAVPVGGIINCTFNVTVQ